MTEHKAEEIGAFCTHDSVHVDGSGEGPLTGLTFAAKDIFDIAGRVCCCGNPDWLATHEPATRTAPAVQALLDAGATLTGMTITEELVMGLTGENPFYGAPVNVAAPGRVTGGSSSGSASAVAAELVDFALGSDTGGSVRVPASFCGIYGIRPTHGRISLEGVMPFAPSLDTVGWFAREAGLMRRVGEVLLNGGGGEPEPRGQLLVASDAFHVIDDDLRAVLMPQVERLSAIFTSSSEVDLAGSAGLEEWSKVIAVYREYEGWQSHRAWIEAHNPKLSDNGAMRMKAGLAVGDAAVSQADKARADVRQGMDELLGDGAILAVPAAPGLAPIRGGGGDEAWRIVSKNGRINAAAALAGLPQISLPLASLDGIPIGLGLIGRAGADEALLEISVALA